MRHETVAQRGQLAYLQAMSNLRPALWSIPVGIPLPGTRPVRWAGRPSLTLSNDEGLLHAHSAPSLAGAYQEGRLVHTCIGHVKSYVAFTDEHS